MAERPILFNGEMVREILAGRKTQTRRPVRPGRRVPDGWSGDVDMWALGPDGRWDAGCRTDGGGSATMLRGVTCPFGAPGDTLWVRETWAPAGVVGDGLEYRADNADPLSGRWTPSIHMPRWASRLTLRVTDVRVECVQDISEEDAGREGFNRDQTVGGYTEPWRSARDKFADAWTGVYGADSWDTNPWVWVVCFDVSRASEVLPAWRQCI